MLDTHSGLKLMKRTLYVHKIIHKALCHIHVYMHLDLVKAELSNDLKKKFRKQKLPVSKF